DTRLRQSRTLRQGYVLLAGCSHSKFGAVPVYDGNAARRALPSFPTRRSSDLPGQVPASGRPHTPWRIDGRPAGYRQDPSGQGGRSEEHTSELQSRENLVCRLLLEKKNARATWYWPASTLASGGRCSRRRVTTS